MKGEKLTRCPNCSYSLSGLPEHHKCPECGFQYSFPMQVFCQARRALVAWVLVLCLASLLAIAVLLKKRGFVMDVWKWLGLMFVCMWLGIQSIRRPANKAVLSADGLAIIGREPNPEIFSWQDLDAARWAPFWEQACFVRRDGTTVTTIETKFFGSRRKTKKFLEAFIEWQQRFSPEPIQPDKCDDAKDG